MLLAERHQLDQAAECNSCAAAIVTAAGPAKRPDAGDFALCRHCGALNIFTAARRLRRPTPAEVSAYVDRAHPR